MALGYAWERFFAAVNSLVSHGTLNERLAGAAVNLIALNPNDFPDENKLRERFSDLVRKLDVLTADREIPRSLDEIEAESRLVANEGETLAKEILSIFNDIALRDPNHHYHIAADIDLVSHFAAIQASRSERVETKTSLKDLTYEELKTISQIMQRAAKRKAKTGEKPMKAATMNPALVPGDALKEASGRKARPKVRKKVLKKPNRG
jgi:hypothetical protein